MHTRYGIVISVIFFCFASAPVAAQLPKPDSLHPPKPDSLKQAADTVKTFFDYVKYRLIGDGNFTRGNVNRTLLVARAEINYTRPVVSFSTHPRFAYGQQNGVQAEREPYIDLFIDLYKKRKIYGFALATVEASNLRDILLRRLAGGGIGFRLVETSKHSLVLTNALMEEYTNFRVRADIVAIRNSTRLKGKHAFLGDKIRLKHVTFLQPALNVNNFRWNTLISSEFPLSKWISLRVAFENTYESVVEVGRQHNDSRLTFGISVGNFN